MDKEERIALRIMTRLILVIGTLIAFLILLIILGCNLGYLAALQKGVYCSKYDGNGNCQQFTALPKSK